MVTAIATGRGTIGMGSTSYIWPPLTAPNLTIANAEKENLFLDGYVSSSAEEPVREYIDAFDAFWSNFLYGPRFHPVTRKYIHYLFSQSIVARTIFRFASIKKVRAIQVMEWRHHWEFGNITCDVVGNCSGDECNDKIATQV